MSKASIRFDDAIGQWVAERGSVGFFGVTDFGEVEFLITADALAELVDPRLDGLDPESALEAFDEHKAVVYRIARREFLRRLGGEPPVLLTSADLDG